MKVLVIGSKGNMGRRYCAILKYLGVEYEGVDMEWNPRLTTEGYTHAIIATPTYVHGESIFLCSEFVKHILCEKPISKSIESIKHCMNIGATDFTDIRMVCNWKYALGNREPGDVDIHYSNYNTGKDGTGWDCIQLIYLANNLEVNTDTPFFSCRATHPNAANYKLDESDFDIITLADIEQSYITMIKNWLEIDGRTNELWDLEDALKATEKTIKWMNA